MFPRSWPSALLGAARDITLITQAARLSLLPVASIHGEQVALVRPGCQGLGADAAMAHVGMLTLRPTKPLRTDAAGPNLAGPGGCLHLHT